LTETPEDRPAEAAAEPETHITPAAAEAVTAPEDVTVWADDEE